jgi:hypothetical protein
LAPTLFRGGISYAEAEIIKPISIISSISSSTTNIMGKGVVNAVGLEKTGNGPNIYCDEKFYNQLKPESNKYFSLTEKANIHCLLWPMFQFSDESSPEIEQNQIPELCIAAAKLYNYHKEENYSYHYAEFIRLIVRSTLLYFLDKRNYKEVKQKLIELAKEYNLSSLLQDFFI